MQRVSTGYTIIEVLIFLAVSGFLLATSIFFLSGKENTARFSQSMRDMQSKVQDWINDAPTGFAGGVSSPTDVNCKLVAKGSRVQPQINKGGGGTNSPDCIFLGKAIQFTDKSTAISGQDSKIFVYSLFGRRTITPVGEDERLVANLIEANPIAAVGVPSYSGTADLTETYTINGGARVNKIVASSGLSDSHLGGFYLSFNPTSVKSNGSADLRAFQYPITGNQPAGTVNGSPIDDCLSFLSVSCTKPFATADDNWPPSLTNWQICFDDGNTQKALLTISSSNGVGVTTKLDFNAC